MDMLCNPGGCEYKSPLGKGLVQIFQVVNEGRYLTIEHRMECLLIHVSIRTNIATQKDLRNTQIEQLKSVCRLDSESTK